MKIFLAGTSFRSEYGGPARSVSQLALALAGRGVEVGVWSADGSAVDSPFLGAGSEVRRLGGTVEEGLKQFGRPELIHDNGIWLPHNHRLAAFSMTLGIPRVVSIRGMLEPWAMRHKRWKKRLAWWLYQRRDLRHAAALHVTSSAERDSVMGFGFGVPVWEVPNGVLLAGAAEVLESVDSVLPRVALFVGRLHPVKGLPMLLEAWAGLGLKGWKLRVVGHDEVGHLAELMQCVDRHRLAEQVEFVGPLEGETLAAAYFGADLFVLSSYTENFGMAVGEALAHEVPVIATRGTPWQVLETEGCGWWVPGNVAGLETGLREAVGKTDGERAAMGRKGRAVVQRLFGWDGIAARMVDGYESIVKSDAKDGEVGLCR